MKRSLAVVVGKTQFSFLQPSQKKIRKKERRVAAEEKGKIREKCGRCRRTKNEFLSFFFCSHLALIRFISLARSLYFIHVKREKSTRTHTNRHTTRTLAGKTTTIEPLSTFSPPSCRKIGKKSK